MKAVRLWEKNNTSPVDLLHTWSLCIQEIYGFKKQYNKNSYCHVKTFAFTLRFSVFLHKYDLSLDLVLKVELDENSSHNSYKTRQQCLMFTRGFFLCIVELYLVFVDGMVYCVHDRLQ